MASAVFQRNLYSVSAQAAMAPNSSVKKIVPTVTDDGIHVVGGNRTVAEHLAVADEVKVPRHGRLQRRVEDRPLGLEANS